MTRAVALTTCLCSLFLCGSFAQLNQRSSDIKVIVLDAGHGGWDPGCGYGGYQEKNIALNITRKVGAYIEENMKDVKVLYTRKDDRYIKLWERASLANRNNASVFVSIHVNSNTNSTVYGTESYTMGTHVENKNLTARIEEQDISSVVHRENEVILEEDDHEDNYNGYDPNDPATHIIFELFQSAYVEQSINLASKIQNQFEERVKRRNRGVKQAGFLVLWKTTMPSVLVETGYLSNATEREYLASEDGQTYLASGIYRAIKSYREEMERR